MSHTRSSTRRVLVGLASGLVAAALAPAASNAAKAPATPKVTSTPVSFAAHTVRPDLALGLLAPRANYNDAQLLTGPGSAGRPIVRGFGGNVAFSDLQANSAYTFRVRNIAVGQTASAWATFSFRTAETFTARPNPPKNLRVTNTTAATVTVAWDAPDSASYSYQAMIGSNLLRLDSGPYVFELQERTFARPPAGATSVFSVAARDSSFNLSQPATLSIDG